MLLTASTALVGVQEKRAMSSRALAPGLGRAPPLPSPIPAPGRCVPRCASPNRRFPIRAAWARDGVSARGAQVRAREPAGEGGVAGRGRARGGSRRPPIAYASASPRRPARAQRAGGAQQELAEVCQAPAEVSGKLQLPLGASRPAHGDWGGGGRLPPRELRGRAHRVPAPVPNTAPAPAPPLDPARTGAPLGGDRPPRAERGALWSRRILAPSGEGCPGLT